MVCMINVHVVKKNLRIVFLTHVIRVSFEMINVILRPIRSSVQHTVTRISSISVSDDIQCGGPSPLGAGLLLTRGVRGAGTVCLFSEIQRFENKWL